MLVALFAAFMLAAGVPQQSPDRARAEALAREGRNAEAIGIFKQIAAGNPADLEVKMWIARLDLRLGHPEDAEAQFRDVLKQRPKDVDARVGLGVALIHKNDWRQALDVLHGVEPEAGQNADLFYALGLAHRRAGDFDRALAYYDRARTLAPEDQDIEAGYEHTMRNYGHWIGFEGFTEFGNGSADRTSGTIGGSFRVTPKLHVGGGLRVQGQAGDTDVLGGGNIDWRASRTTNVLFQALGGPTNVSLPTSDIAGAVVNYLGAFELGASVRVLSFTGTDVFALSPLASWDNEKTRTDFRYTYSRSHFTATDQTSGDHSIMVREMWRARRRVWLSVTYAYGIESFEQLTADRLGSLGSNTLAGSLKLIAPAFDVVTTWEHQWRSNDTSIDRLTVAAVRFFR
jgi:hypothetical protein